MKPLSRSLVAEIRHESDNDYRTMTFYGTTVNGANGTIDTGYREPANTVSKINGLFSVADLDAETANGQDIIGAFRSIPTFTIAAFTSVNPAGDSTLNGCSITASIVSNQVRLTLHPPSEYSGTIHWMVQITPTINAGPPV